MTSSSHVLDLVCTDICCPTPILSSNGFRYFVIFVDDFLHFSWYYPMHLKSYLYAIFECFHALVERSFSCKIESVQSDLGGEYKKLHSFFTKLGINHHQSCAYTHE